MKTKSHRNKVQKPILIKFIITIHKCLYIAEIEAHMEPVCVHAFNHLSDRSEARHVKSPTATGLVRQKVN